MQSETGEDLFSLLFPQDTASEIAVQTLSRTVYTQPALFALEYAIARLFMSYGIAPAACIGHSIGELTAAAVAGVFSFEQGLKIILRRAKIMDTMQRGSMVFVTLNEKDLQSQVSGNLVIALVNGPSSCVVAGPTDEITPFLETMKKNGVRCGLLQTSHAFHSPMMDEAGRQFKEYLDSVPLSKPTLPFISNVTGTWITGDQCTSSRYWADHLRKTVRFSDGVTELLNKNYLLFLEIGPGNTLSTLINMHTQASGQLVTVQSLHHGKQQADDEAFFTNAIGELWSAGVTIDWSGFYPLGIPNKVPLPSYPFERQRYWIEYSNSAHVTAAEAIASNNTGDSQSADPVQTQAVEMADLTSRESLFKLVTDAWREVLRIDQCGPDDSFVVLGGNSLMLSQVVSRINQRLPYILHMSFLMGSYTINEQVERLLEFGRSNPLSTAQTINEPVPHAEKETLSPAQQRLWYLCQLNQHTPAFNLTHTFRLRGQLNLTRLENAVTTIIQRHPSLRSTFSHIDGVPIVRVIEDLPLSLSITECICSNRDESEKLAADHIRKEAAILYDLEKGPLFKCRLYRVAPDEYIFVFYIHHIISDGWSMAVILKELSALYNTPQGQRDSVPGKLKINYFDYAAYMNNIEELSLHQDDTAFWKEYFKDGLPILSLPTDFPRPKTLKFTAKLLTFTLPPELMRKITAYAGAKKVTPFSILLAMYGLLLYRNARQERIIIGCPIAGRNRVEFEPLIGLFLNMIPFNLEFKSDMSVEELTFSTYRNTVDVFAHQNLQFGKLVELLQPERHLNINHVFQTMFAYNNYLFSDNTPGEVIFEPEKSDRGSSEYDLSLYMWSSDDTLHGAFEYNDELFLPSTIEGLRSQFQTLLEAALEDPSLLIVNAPVYSVTQTAALLEQKFSSDRTISAQDTVHALLDLSFLEYQEATAVTDGKKSFRYGELYERSNQVCNGLLHAGVTPGTLVGIHMSRSINLLPVMVGILKAGAAYIPLDPLFPAERIDYMIADASLRFIIADIPNGKRFTGSNNIRILTYDDADNTFLNQSTSPPPSYVDSESLAYILYTSGSTGAPKGVEIQHKAVVNFLLSMKKAPGITRNDKLLAVTTISFDISGLELLLPLTAGASITLVDSMVAADGFQLKQRIETSGTTIMQATPATWRMLLEAGWNNGSGFKVLCGGEAMSRDLADRLLATGAEVWNMYGPTETTIWSSISRIKPGTAEPDIGVPIDNTQFFFLDDAHQEVPRGVIAELCIGGIGLARGYHKKPELTEKKFIPISFGGRSIRVYRTGDLVRCKADGTIEFLGRSDQQVKIRGYRIELEEIETVLNRHSSVQQAVVSTYTTAGGKELVAYIRLDDGTALNTTSLREHLGVHLPHYMIPSAIVEIDAFPLTPNGKVDRKKLPAPQTDSIISTTAASGQNLGKVHREESQHNR
jgi:amino acid adenylation domain-containing protein